MAQARQDWKKAFVASEAELADVRQERDVAREACTTLQFQLDEARELRKHAMTRSDDFDSRMNLAQARGRQLEREVEFLRETVKDLARAVAARLGARS